MQKICIWPNFTGTPKICKIKYVLKKLNYKVISKMCIGSKYYKNK